MCFFAGITYYITSLTMRNSNDEMLLKVDQRYKYLTKLTLYPRFEFVKHCYAGFSTCHQLYIQNFCLFALSHFLYSRVVWSHYVYNLFIIVFDNTISFNERYEAYGGLYTMRNWFIFGQRALSNLYFVIDTNTNLKNKLRNTYK